MRTIFGYFENYTQAQEAVSELLAHQYDEGEMNAVVQAQVARNHLDGLDLEQVKHELAPDQGNRTAYGLNELLAGQQPVQVNDVGPVYAAGALASLLAKSAAYPGANNSLKDALVNFDVPDQEAEHYRQSVADGGLLFFIRTPDDQAAQAANLLRKHNAHQVASYTPSTAV